MNIERTPGRRRSSSNTSQGSPQRNINDSKISYSKHSINSNFAYSSPSSAPSSSSSSTTRSSVGVKTSKQIFPFENEALRLKQKCKDLSQKITDLEGSNELQTLLVSRLRQAIKRLRFEYTILMESLEKKSIEGPIPNIGKITADNLDPSDLQGLSLDDITKLLTTTPYEIAKANELLLPYIQDELELDPVNIQRQQQLQRESQNTNVSCSDNVPLASANSSPEVFKMATMKASTGDNKRKKRGNGSSQSSKSKLKKQPKDPNLPKKPTNAYLVFCEQNKARLKTNFEINNPGSKVDMSKITSEAWNSMDKEGKKPYYEVFQKDQVRYHAEMEEYNRKKEAGLFDDVDGGGSNVDAYDNNDNDDDDDDDVTQMAKKKTKNKKKKKSYKRRKTDDDTKVKLEADDNEESSNLRSEDVDSNNNNQEYSGDDNKEELMTLRSDPE
ncbi:unnamed protein product [Ambrosiozyma monospora]|uniref:Unnamed protein product n=1 Tax=Ambrosiozyma monospora TaxID=43982 RepID=A0A9W6YWG3_AMBMO|nr:unnamed protein product [Ambrosiozyma monospora]